MESDPSPLSQEELMQSSQENILPEKQSKKLLWILLGGGGLLVAILIVVFIGFAAIGFMVGDESDDSRINTEEEYYEEFSTFWADYSDATILLAAIAHIDNEVMDYKTWQDWIDSNDAQWSDIEMKGTRILEYLSSENIKSVYSPYAPLLFKQPAIAQSEDGTPIQIRDFEKDVILDALVAYDAHGRGEQLKAVMEITGLESPREAHRLIAEYKGFELNDFSDVEFYDKLSTVASTTRDVAFVSVAVGGIVIAGPAMGAATTVAGKAVIAIPAAVTGADLVLKAGKQTAVLMDNRELQTVFVEAQENLVPVADVIGIISLNTNLANPENLISIYKYGDLLLDWHNQTEVEDEVYNIDISPIDRSLFISQDASLYQQVVEASDPYLEAINTMFPPGGFVVEDTSYTTDVSTNQKSKSQPKTVTEPEPVEVDNVYVGGPSSGYHSTGEVRVLVDGEQVSVELDLVAEGVNATEGFLYGTITGYIEGVFDRDFTGDYFSIDGNVSIVGEHRHPLSEVWDITPTNVQHPVTVEGTLEDGVITGSLWFGSTITNINYSAE